MYFLNESIDSVVSAEDRDALKKMLYLTVFDDAEMCSNISVYKVAEHTYRCVYSDSDYHNNLDLVVTISALEHCYVDVANDYCTHHFVITESKFDDAGEFDL